MRRCQIVGIELGIDRRRDTLPLLRLMSQNFQIISISGEIMGGTPVFIGTRVPVQTLFDYLEAGESIDDFLDGFPTVTREQVIALLEVLRKQLIAIVA